MLSTRRIQTGLHTKNKRMKRLKIEKLLLLYMKKKNNLTFEKTICIESKIEEAKIHVHLIIHTNFTYCINFY